MKYFLPFLIVVLHSCASKSYQTYNLKTSDIVSTIDTLQIEENGSLTDIEIVGHTSLLNFNKDTVRLYIASSYRQIPDSALDPISNQLTWLSKNKNKVFNKFKEVSSIRKNFKIKTISTDEQGTLTLTFLNSSEEVNRKLQISTTGEITEFNGY